MIYSNNIFIQTICLYKRWMGRGKRISLNAGIWFKGYNCAPKLLHGHLSLAKAFLKETKKHLMWSH